MVAKEQSMTTITRPRAGELDKKIGARLRKLRVLRGMTQQQFAEAVGITFQQAGKYENGINRVSAARLWRCSQVLGVPVNDFFDGIEDQVTRISPDERSLLGLAQNMATLPPETIAAILQLVRAVAAENARGPFRSEEVALQDAAEVL